MSDGLAHNGLCVLIVAAGLAGRGAGLPPTGGATLIGLGSTGVQAVHGPGRARGLRAAGELQGLCAQVVLSQTNMMDSGRSTATRHEPPTSATMMLLVVLTMGIAIDNFLATPSTACVSNPMNLLGETPSCLSMAAALALVTTAPAKLSPDRPQLTQQMAPDDAFSSVPHELSQPHRLMLFDHPAMIVLSRVGRPL